MNEHFSAYIGLGHRIAMEHGVNWNVRLRPDGEAAPGDAWNLTQFIGDPPPPVHWVRDFGLHPKALQILNEMRSQQNYPTLLKTSLSPGWLDLLKAAIVEQLFFRKNSTGHIVNNVVGPIRVLATVMKGRDPWELRVDDVAQAFMIAKKIQASGKLADMVLGIVKTIIDANHIADIGPLSSALPFKKHAIRERKARYTKSMDELRADLKERKHAEKLPERRAFWELVRIVFTEKPRSVLDLLRFAQVKVMLLCGIRVGESCLLPVDWKRIHEYCDASGRAAGELGGYSTALMIRHFAEKQQAPNSDSVALFESAQYVPSMFEGILTEALNQVARVTQPLRETLQRQVEERRPLPWFKQEQLVSAIELYPYLTGNPVLLKFSDKEQEYWEGRYRTQFDPKVLKEMHDAQLREINAGRGILNNALYTFYHRLKGKITFRYQDGSAWLGSKIQWNHAFIRIDEIEKYLSGLTTKQSDIYPHRLLPSGELPAWELLFLMPKRALSDGRNDGLCDLARYYSVGRFDPNMMYKALVDSVGSTSLTLFESYGNTDEDRALRLNPHALRHLQNTELFRLGVADTIITKRFNRKTVAQSYEYDHRSLAEDLDAIELPIEIEASLGTKAATVARMIAAGKASGPIIDSFKSIQKSLGDAAAFEFLKVEADGFHSTPYGHCINSFTVDPCPKHLECFAGCRHLTATDLPNFRSHLIQLEGRIKDVLKALEDRSSKSIGRDNQIAHARTRLDAVRRILATPEGAKVFPDGLDLSRSDIKQRSLLDANE